MSDEQVQEPGAPDSQGPGVSEELARLRRENANWRRKVRTLEVGMELTKRGVQADPSWVKVQEGMQVQEAVDAFVQQWPHLVKGTNGNGSAPHAAYEEEDEELQPVPAALPPTPKRANNPGPPAKGTFSGRSLEEIRKDPKARKALSEHYQQLRGYSTSE
jgi:hypothetical protein